MAADETLSPHAAKSPGRVQSILDWMRSNPIFAFAGIAISAFASSRGLPPAWETAMHMIGCPPCVFYGDAYHYATGGFTRSGKTWHETNNDGQFDFVEVRRDPDFIRLNNTTPRPSHPPPGIPIIKLPACGGNSEINWSAGDKEEWQHFHDVWK